MKQLIAIFLIAVFAISQYAKQLSYMECRLSNSLKSGTEQCDCEKKYDIHSLNDKKPVSQQTHFHPVIDEFYSTPQNNVPVDDIYSSCRKIIIPFAVNLCNGNNQTPYRPPQV